MTNRQLEPGDTAWVIDRYVNSVKEKIVTHYLPASGAVAFKGICGSISLALVFDTESEAIDGLIARAEETVAKSQKELAKAQAAVKGLRKKFSRPESAKVSP